MGGVTLKRALCLALITLLPAAALADKDMTGAEFLARVEGRTVYWTDQGRFFGAETFHDDRNVTWQDAVGNCLTGTWAERARADLLSLCRQSGAARLLGDP